MSINRSQEERALDKSEMEMVAKSHHPQLQDLEDKELASLLKLVRERRDKARTEMQRRRREMRGKAAPKGATPSASAEGNKTKLEVLSTAVRRLNGERSRRDRMASQVSQAELSRNALKLKQEAGDNDEVPFNTRHAHQGMRKIAAERRNSLVRPMERGRLRKAAAVAQAKRDSR
ncbi:hypothetical protein [Tianweitania sediminis]|uniref:Uncharacterized protein n=1 Tax=Tianweitania sediminis TaxID=1502156 RepID=A0A8J7R0Z2_9HYPH|nr:hypothetical protein [Tianweitania sediminis]MBP0438121.1 hypothetical protein [Tianweitania sediminis]